MPPGPLVVAECREDCLDKQTPLIPAADVVVAALLAVDEEDETGIRIRR